MKKKQTHQMKLNNNAFKMIKKNKKNIVLRLNDEKRQKINIGDKIIFTNTDTNKTLKKKVKKLHKYSNFEELYKNINKKKLGYKRKEIANYIDMEKYYSKEDIKKYGVVGIELKAKRSSKKQLLWLLIITGMFTLYFGGRNLYYNWNDNKVKKAISNLESERIDYLFIEINPSLVITIKDNKVNDVACLNDDCLTIYDDINIIGKDINDSIENLYNLAKDKGLNISDGVIIKTTSNLSINNLDFVKVEHIDETTKNELISKVINNNKIENNSNDDYYSKLWNELKKDNDYGSVYDCKMNNKVLECYVIPKYFQFNPKDLSTPTNSAIPPSPADILKAIDISDRFKRLYGKFNIKYITQGPLATIDEIYIGNVIYDNGYNFDGWDAIPYGEMYLKRVDNEAIYNCDYYILTKDINLLNPEASLHKGVTYNCR